MSLLVGKVYRFTLESLVQEDKGGNPVLCLWFHVQKNFVQEGKGGNPVVVYNSI